MQINQEITMHLDRKGFPAIIDAVQGETGRSVTLALFDKGQPWTVPADASILIRYRKPDCTGGIYDSLPDGTRAWDIRGSLVDIRIAPQTLAVSGVTAMQIAIVAEGEELASFIFHLRVESDPSVGTLASQDYINIGQWLMPRLYQFVSQAETAAAAAIRAAEEALATAAGISSRYTPPYAVCGLDPADGCTIENASAIVSDFFPMLNNTLGVAFSSLVTVRMFYYDGDLNFLGADLTRTESFELTVPAGAKFARVEIRYAVGFAVDEPEKLAGYVTLYIPNTSADDACRAEAAADQAFQSADDARTAAQSAQDAVKGSVKTVNGVAPDENGNVTVAGVGGSGIQSVNGIVPDESGNITLPYLQIDIRKLMGYDTIAYNGSTPNQKDIGSTFRFIEPNAYNGQSNILYAHLGEMPAVLNGTFKATANAETEYNFEFAYGFSGGFSDASHHITACVVIEPATGKIYRFAYDDENTCTVTESTIGESGGDAEIQPLTFTGAVEATYDGTVPVEIPIPSGGSGLQWTKVVDFTTEEEVSVLNIDVADIIEQLRAANFMRIEFYGAKVSSADVISTSPTGTFQWVTGSVSRTWIDNGKFLPMQENQTSGLYIIGQFWGKNIDVWHNRLVVGNMVDVKNFNQQYVFGLLSGVQKFVITANNTAIGAGSTFKIFIA